MKCLFNIKMPETPERAERAEDASCKATAERNRRTTVCFLIFALLLSCGCQVQAAPVPVRHIEGMVRGFLVLSNSKGVRIASGDFLQIGQGGEIKTRTVLYFKDGSLHDETAVFTQQRAFIMKSYRLVQKGPAFTDEMDVTLNRATGKYRVKVKGRKDGQEKVLEGKLDMPLDVYNGMVPIVAKNLKGAKAIVHIVVFTPTPRVVELEMIPSGKEWFLIGDLKKGALHYVLKPQLGMLKLPATLLGRTPPDNHVWIITAEVPAFVKFEGPLALSGPIWRIEMASPAWPK